MEPWDANQKVVCVLGMKEKWAEVLSAKPVIKAQTRSRTIVSQIRMGNFQQPGEA